MRADPFTVGSARRFTGVACSVRGDSLALVNPLCSGGREMTEDGTRHPNEIVIKLSPRSVPDTVARLTAMLSGKGLKLFATIDQSAEAAAAGLTLRETVLVI